MYNKKMLNYYYLLLSIPTKQKLKRQSFKE